MPKSGDESNMVAINNKVTCHLVYSDNNGGTLCFLQSLVG